MYFRDYPNRTACDVMEEARKCYESRNFAGILGMIEELQSMFNKMEASLNDKNDAVEYKKTRKELAGECKKLTKKKRQLEEKISALSDSLPK